MTGSRWGAGSIVIVLAVIGLFVVSGRGDGSASTGAIRGARPFPEFRVIEDSVDYLDPALSYTAEGWEPLSTVYLSLLGYRQVAGPAGATVVPCLERACPSSRATTASTG
jgi:hypothetical protein